MGAMKEITLPYSKQTAMIRRPTGRDIVEAERVVGNEAGDRAYNLSLLSRVVMIDGKSMPYEDLLCLDSDDIQALMKVDLGFTESHPAPS